MPQDPGEAWTFVVGLDGDSRMALLAHCAGLSVNAVRTWERRPGALAHADVLAQALSLDMTANWTATERSYFGRVTKARIGEAVAEAVGEDAAERIGGMKKQPMAEAAEQLVAGSGWLPPLLRTPKPSSEEAVQEDGPSEGAYPAAAE
jgi:ParB family chromosome partitioning protein